MDTILIYPIVLPFVAALACFLLPGRQKQARESLAFLVTLANLALAIFLFVQPPSQISLPWLTLGSYFTVRFDLQFTPFGRLVLLGAASFALLALLYSFKYLQSLERHQEYYAYFLAALGATAGAVLANNFIVLLFFWELIGFILYLMIMITGNEAIPAARKAMLISITGDLLLLLGILFLWMSSGTLTISEIVARPQVLSSPATVAAFFLMLGGAFAKAGIIPLHSWIPEISTEAPIPVMSYFTALDKLTGIYLLTNVALKWFVMDSAASLFLMTMGAFTLLAGVLMAVIQQDYRRMLAFHSVSQVGYMVLGIGTGNPLGILGGLFHMLNMVVLKGNLFLCGGSVQRQTNRTKFDDLGGLAQEMPWTFASAVIASLGIAGIPPLNAFVSKWLIYQGILEQGGIGFPVFLVVAMFGSALTLASFMKFLYSMFWGEKPRNLKRVREVPNLMRIPMLILAALTVFFGIFYRIPLQGLLQPILTTAGIPLQTPGLWQSGLAAGLLLLSLLAGLIFFLAGQKKRMPDVEVFLGGEALNSDIYRVPGTHFYGPFKEMIGLKQLLALGEKGSFDLYNYGAALIKWISRWVYQYIDQALSDFYQEVIPSLLSLFGQILRLLNSGLILTRVLWILYGASLVGIWLFPGNQDLSTLTRIIACLGMVGWSILALVETDLSHLLLLAATSQFGFAVLAVTISSRVALSYLTTGSIALAALFLIAHSIQKSLKTSQLEHMNGLASRMPGRFLIFLLAALWLSGLPPFGSFFSKYMLGVAAGEISPILTIVITGTAILTLGYLLHPIRRFLRIVG